MRSEKCLFIFQNLPYGYDPTINFTTLLLRFLRCQDDDDIHIFDKDPYS